MAAARIRKWIIIIGIIVVATCAMRIWWWEVFRVPTQSMAPTLSINDFLLVNKLAYGSPISKTKRPPDRGDVIVFPHPQTHTLYVKRVIGLPNDEVMILGANVWINGMLVEDVRIDGSKDPSQSNAKIEQRRLSNGTTYRTLTDEDSMIGWKMSGYWIVPNNQVFVMGDWRDHSSDSREWGSVPINGVVGKVVCSWGESSHGCQF